jgi:hypothetical protein
MFHDVSSGEKSALSSRRKGVCDGLQSDAPSECVILLVIKSSILPLGLIADTTVLRKDDDIENMNIFDNNVKEIAFFLTTIICSGM